jgi:hypothetical protein
MKIYLMYGSQIAHEGEIVQTDRISTIRLVKTSDGMFVAWDLEYYSKLGDTYAIATSWKRNDPIDPTKVW